jgi:Leucine-rich repeat (LRR) protein
MRILRFAMMLMTAAAALATLGGCSVEDPQGAGDYGYVQFKLYKEASYVPASKAAEIDYLADITKARITMRYQGSTLNQTLVFSAADKVSAEFGIRSEKLQLLAGDYEVLSFVVYDKNDNEGPSVSGIGNPRFTVTAGGMTVHDMTVGTSVVPSRGNIRFTLVKDMSDFGNLPTRSLEDHTFDEAKYITMRVEKTSSNEQISFANIPVKFSIHFNEEDDANIYPDGYGKEDNFGYQTSSLKADSLLYLLAGDYRVRSYTLSDGTKTAFETRSFDRSAAPVFNVADNKTLDVKVPVALSEDAPYLQDYYALYEIWKSLDGPNWYYRGENYPEGTNWDFNKDPDLWGDQSGVRLHSNGRVASLDLTDFGIKGDLSPAVGQLTELVQFYLSTHNDINNFDFTDPGQSAQMLSRTRMERHKKYLAELHPLTQLSEPIAFGFAEKKETIREVSLYAKGYTESQIYAMEKGTGIRPMDNNPGTLTNGLTSIPEEIGNLTKMEYLYIANCEIENLPSAESMSKLVALTDFEVYNCPKLKMTDDNIASLGAMPSLVSINLGNNGQWTSQECDKLMRALAYGPSSDKIQIFYFRNNKLDALKSEYFSRFKKIGLLDLVNNEIETVERLGSEIAPVQIYLDYNRIKEIPDNEGGEILFTMDDVEAFSVSHNMLEVFPDVFDAKSIFTIGSVDFSYNNIDRISGGDDFKGINVKTLSLASNKFTEYPLEFTHSNSVVSVYNFRGNGMRTIDKDAFDYTKPNRDKLTYTQTFDFTYNRLDDLPVTFGDSAFPYLYSVDLSYNAFKEFPYEPLNYISLTAYAIRGQRDDNGKRILKQWPEGLYNHRGLRGFYIGSNAYERIDDKISQLIYYFDISDNPNIEFDASDICLAWRAGAYKLIYDKSQNILNCPEMLN